jgi:hypothetical protein
MLGGRPFATFADGWTVGHDIWFAGQIARAGLNTVRIMEHETPEFFTRRILETALMSGQVLELLGGLLLPEGVKPADWTVETAEETAKYLAGLTSAEDKETVNSLISSLLLDFFVTGLTWPSRSRSSSDASQPVGEKKSGTATGSGAESSVH